MGQLITISTPILVESSPHQPIALLVLTLPYMVC